MQEKLYSEPIILILAYMLDLVIGDPVQLPHPVRVIGWGVTKMEGLLGKWELRNEKRGIMEKFKGILLVITIIVPTFLITWFIVYVLSLLTSYFSLLAFLVLIYLTSTTLATNELIKSARLVVNSLKADKIDDARRNLSYIVGRDTDRLNKDGILRATIESVAENASDGIIAPLFYFAVGGLPLAMAYKAINTLDSMVGYKNEKYKDFGWASARLDDFANYIPARITGILIIITTFIMNGLNRLISPNSLNGLNSLNSLRIMLRDGKNHLSPNSGIPEAAMAGALGVRLGGPSFYGGIQVEKPYIGVDKTEDIYLEISEKAITMTRITSLLGFLCCLAILYVRTIL